MEFSFSKEVQAQIEGLEEGYASDAYQWSDRLWKRNGLDEYGEAIPRDVIRQIEDNIPKIVQEEQVISLAAAQEMLKFFAGKENLPAPKLPEVSVFIPVGLSFEGVKEDTKKGLEACGLDRLDIWRVCCRKESGEIISASTIYVDEKGVALHHPGDRKPQVVVCNGGPTELGFFCSRLGGLHVKVDRGGKITMLGWQKANQDAEIIFAAASAAVEELKDEVKWSGRFGFLLHYHTKELYLKAAEEVIRLRMT